MRPTFFQRFHAALRLVWRIPALALTATFSLVYLCLCDRYSGKASMGKHINRVTRLMLWATGVRRHVVFDEAGNTTNAATTTANPQLPVIVANHISWCDILAIDSYRAVRFVAKKEIESWPLVGPMARAARSVFIDRSKRSSVRLDQQSIAPADDLPIAFFPEGTTGNPGNLLPFHSSLFDLAVKTGADIQPIVIHYQGCYPGFHLNEAQVGLWGGAVNKLRQPITVTLIHLAPIPSSQHNRRDLAKLAQHAIAKKLESLHASFNLPA